MRWIAVTGPMGSGKSTVASMLRQLGFNVLDADQVVHQVLGPGGAAEASVFKTFGETVRAADGRLDRRALGRLVFGDPAKLALLEGLLHPLVRQDVLRRRGELEQAGHAAAFYDVPLLFEKKMEASFDAVLVVTAPAEARHKRLFDRSGLTLEEVLERSKSQLPPEYKEARASFLIRNDGDLKLLESRVRDALKHLGLKLPADRQP